MADLNFTPMFMDPYDRRLLVLNNEYLDTSNNTETNKVLIEELYTKKFDQISSYNEFAKIPDEIISALNKVRDDLANGLTANTGKLTDSIYKANKAGGLSGVLGASISEMFEPMVNQIVTSVTSVTSIPAMLNLPNLPLVEEIPVAMEKFAAMSDALNDLPKEIKDKMEEDKKKNKVSWKDRLKLPPKVVNTINDIVDSIKQAIREWKEFVVNFYHACFNALLDLLLAVFAFFGIEPGFPLNLIKTVETMAKQLYDFSKRAVQMLRDYLVEKLMEPINAAKYLANGNANIDYTISALELKNIRNSIELSANILRTEVEKSKKIFDDATIEKEKSDEKILNNINFYEHIIENATEAPPEEIQDCQDHIQEYRDMMEKSAITLSFLEEDYNSTCVDLSTLCEVSADIVASLAKTIAIRKPSKDTKPKNPKELTDKAPSKEEAATAAATAAGGPAAGAAAGAAASAATK